jgi:hypothetical protein
MKTVNGESHPFSTFYDRMQKLYARTEYNYYDCTCMQITTNLLVPRSQNVEIIELLSRYIIHISLGIGAKHHKRNILKTQK